MKTRWLVFVCFTCSLTIVNNSQAQNQQKLDSLLKELKLTKPDTSRARILFTLTWESMQGRSTKMARSYADSAMNLCLALNYEKGIATVNYYLGVMGRLEGEFDVALKHFEAYNLYYEQQGDSTRLAYALYQMAVIFQRQGNFQQALEAYLKTFKIHESNRALFGMANALNGIGIIYKNMDKLDEALEHYQKALEIFSELDKKLDMADCLNNIGNVHSIKEQYAKALHYYEEAHKFNKVLGNEFGIAYSLSNMGLVYGSLKQYDKALINHRKSLAIRLELNQKKEISQSYASLGESFLKLQMYDSAIAHFHMSVSLAEEIGAAPELRQGLSKLSDVYAKQGDFRKAYDHHKRYAEVNDSLFNESTTQQINELQAKYEYEKKEKEIAVITKENKMQEAQLLQEKNLKRLFVLGIILLVLLIFFIVVNYKQKLKNRETVSKKNEEINRRKIMEIEQRQKLSALDAMVNGQEAERKRIAQDLHDGLGVLLSNVQMHFNSMQEEINKIMELDRYRKANQLLNEASDEVRKIAHNMMPGTLLKLGLVPAIKDICNNINQTTTINVEFHAFDLEERLDEPTEVSVYRLVQEALSNVVKHAYAKEVLVQLFKNEDGLNITVEDDGVGFNIAQVRKKGGMGLGNLESRVKYLNGELQIISSAGKGTVLTIDIPVTTNVPENSQI